MQYSRPNFKPTAQTSRYLREIQQYWLQKENEGVPRYDIKNQDWLEIETALPHEKMTPADSKSVAKFLGWLQKNHAIEFKEDYSSVLDLSDVNSEEHIVPARLRVRVRDIEPVLYLEKYSPADNELPKVPSEATAYVSFETRDSGEKEICFKGTGVRKFQINPVDASFTFGNVFDLLWQYRLHYTRDGLIPNGRARKLSLALIESRLKKNREERLPSRFIKDLQSNLAKLRKQRVGASLKIDDEADAVQLVIDERSS